MLLICLCSSTLVKTMNDGDAIPNGVQYQCFHNFKSSDKSNNISSCKYLVLDDRIYHTIALRDPVSFDSLPQLTSVTYHFNKNDLVCDVRENASVQPLCSMYQLDKRTDSAVILQLASQMVTFFLNLLPAGHRFSNLLKETDCINFLQVHAAYGVTSKFEHRFIILNRHLLQDTQLSDKQRVRKMISMIYGIANVTKALLFAKNKKSTLKTLQPCTKQQCKLTTYSPRFIDMYSNNNLLCELHAVFCTSSSPIETFENLYRIIPINRSMLNEAIGYIQGSFSY